MAKTKIMEKPLPTILDEMDENIESAREAARVAREEALKAATAARISTEAARVAEAAGEKAAQKATEAAESAAKEAKAGALKASELAKLAEAKAAEAIADLESYDKRLSKEREDIIVCMTSLLSLVYLLADTYCKLGDGYSMLGTQLKENTAKITEAVKSRIRV